VILRHQVGGDPDAATEARELALGLLHLFDAASSPGFLPRGLALDGMSHYTNSSVDQYTMVRYGLYQYHQSSMASSKEQQAIREVWHNVLTRWEADGWEDRREDGSPGFYGDIGALRPDRSCRLLAALLGGWKLTGEERWHRIYLEKVRDQDGTRLRPALPQANGPLYVADQNQVAWRILADLEEDAARQAEYQKRLAETAAHVRERLLAYREFDVDAHKAAVTASNWDWRKGCVENDPEGNQGAAYNQRLRGLAPVVPYEHRLVQTPFEAAHVLLLSAAPASIDFLQPHLAPLFGAYDYERLMLSWSIYETEWNYWLAVAAGLV